MAQILVIQSGPKSAARAGGASFRQGAGMILLACLLLFPSHGLPAQETGGRYIDEGLQMALADQFFQEGDYSSAVREYKRFLFFFPQSPRAEEARLKMANAFFREGKWDEALSACDSLIGKTASPAIKAEAFILQGNAWAQKKDYPRARDSFRLAGEAAPGTALAGEAQMQLARTYLREEKWKEAAREFRKVEPGSPWYPKSESLARGLDRIQEVPQKSPAAAGVLSAVLPGAGQAYSEEYGRAAIAFVLNGLFIWGMIESFNRENYVVGGILAFFEVGFYSANILNAVNSAQKYNRRKTWEYIRELEKGGGLSLGLSLQGGTPALAFQYVY